MKETRIILWSEVRAGDEALWNGKLRTVTRAWVHDVGDDNPWFMTDVEYEADGITRSFKTKSDKLTAVQRETLPVLRDNDTLTVGEVTAALKRKIIRVSDEGAESFIQDILDHREVLEDDAVYVSADNRVLRWDSHEYGFRTFGQSGLTLHDVPRRPLKKVEL